MSGSKETELIVERGKSCCILRRYIRSQKSRESNISVLARGLPKTSLKNLKPF